MHFAAFCFKLFWASVMIVHISSSQDVKVSDACHGQRHIQATYNVLKCGPGMAVKIVKVRLYLVSEADRSRPRFSRDIDTPSKCCQHNISACNWEGSDENSVGGLQSQCEPKDHCILHSSIGEKSGGRCGTREAQSSGIRSISYVCIEPEDMTSLTTHSPHFSTGEESKMKAKLTASSRFLTPAKSTRKPRKPKLNTSLSLSTAEFPSTKPKLFTLFPSTLASTTFATTSASTDVGIAVGAALGGLAMICLTVILLVVLRRRGRSRRKPSAPSRDTARAVTTNVNLPDLVHADTADNIYTTVDHDPGAIAVTNPNYVSGEYFELEASSNANTKDKFSQEHQESHVYHEITDFSEHPWQRKSNIYDRILGEGRQISDAT